MKNPHQVEAHQGSGKGGSQGVPETHIKIKTDSNILSCAIYVGKLLFNSKTLVVLQGVSSANPVVAKIVEYLKHRVQGLHCAYEIVGIEFDNRQDQEVNEDTRKFMFPSLKAKLSLNDPCGLDKLPGYMPPISDMSAKWVEKFKQDVMDNSGRYGRQPFDDQRQRNYTGQDFGGYDQQDGYVNSHPRSNQGGNRFQNGQEGEGFYQQGNFKNYDNSRFYPRGNQQDKRQYNPEGGNDRKEFNSGEGQGYGNHGFHDKRNFGQFNRGGPKFYQNRPNYQQERQDFPDNSGPNNFRRGFEARGRGHRGFDSYQGGNQYPKRDMFQRGEGDLRPQYRPPYNGGQDFNGRGANRGIGHDRRPWNNGNQGNVDQRFYGTDGSGQRTDPTGKSVQKDQSYNRN